MLLIDKEGRKANVKMEITKNGSPYIKHYELDFFADLEWFDGDAECRICDNISWTYDDLVDWSLYADNPEAEAYDKEKGFERVFTIDIL